MARKKGIDMSGIDDILENGIAEDEVLNPAASPKKQQTSDTNVDTETEQLAQDSLSNFSFITDDDESIKKTFVVDAKIAEVIDALVHDPVTGKKRKGSKGVISKIVNNALRKELVSLKLMNKEELKKNLPY
ncbi:hypothetical protein HCA68_15500 [Listeria booriae]|uniref:hypothetical protein n=1 Tax=Listeria booriae TaxID=1552123 RepID=UPI00162A2AF6|nr:hypothetical protein [Listeria booriae]MBC1899075.1 hypothetical protein [Listeria booriae]